MVKFAPVFLMLCLTVLSVPIALAQVQVKVVLEPSEIPYHKPAFLSLVVEAPETVEVQLPDLRDILLEATLIGDKKAVADYRKESLGEGRVRITETYALNPNYVQDYTFDPLSVTVGEETITVPGPTLRVRDLTEEEILAAEQFDETLVGGPMAISRPLTQRWQFWAILFVIAVALTVALAYWWRTRKEFQELDEGIESWAKALMRLENLSARNLPKQGYYEAYYVDLSAILRYYIEGRFQIHAPERTSQEFLFEIMKDDTFDSDQQAFLKAFLNLCDRVKFAKHQPGLIHMEESFVQVRKFVEDTIPHEIEADSEEEAVA